MATRRNSHIQYNYGICLNENCDKAKTKDIQRMPAHKELVCEVCGKPLRKCPPPKQRNDKKLIILIIMAILLFSGGMTYLLMTPHNEDKPTPNIQPESPVDSVESLATDTLALDNQNIEKEEKPKETAVTPKPVASEKDLGYATFKGKLKNDLPNDENGTMTFKVKHLIDKRDSQKRMAEPGDYIIGEFIDGKLVQGIWYNAKNTVKGSIIIGR